MGDTCIELHFRFSVLCLPWVTYMELLFRFSVLCLPWVTYVELLFRFVVLLLRGQSTDHRPPRLVLSIVVYT